MQKQTSQQQLQSIGRFFHKHRKKFYIFISITLLLGDIMLFGNIQYAAKWASCGQRPVFLANSGGMLGSQMNYSIVTEPSFLESKSTALSGGLAEFNLYCTVDQAKSVIPASSPVEIR